MSFLSILKTIGTDLEKGIFIAAGVGQAAAPILTGIDPPAGALLGLVCNAIFRIEELIPALGAGALKKGIVVQIVDANSAEPPDPAQMSTAIDGLVAAFNAFAAIETAKTAKLAVNSPAAAPGIHLVPTPPAAP